MMMEKPDPLHTAVDAHWQTMQAELMGLVRSQQDLLRTLTRRIDALERALREAPASEDRLLDTVMRSRSRTFGSNY